MTTVNSSFPSPVISIADSYGKIRLSSGFGWMLNQEQKPVCTDRDEQ
ncbi:MAG TPA: hypothetical protein V6D10_06510 [Trichocoleus sp.]